MNKLEKYILEKGKFIDSNVLKVDSFLNHQIDPVLMKEMGDEFYEYFKNHGITKIVTIETSGIAPALMCALRMDVPLVFIKKTHPSTMSNPLTASVHSFTKNKTYSVCLDKEFISSNDRILFIDDFLANGEAFKGAEEIINQANAKICGVGMVIEKAFQKGHQYILDKGYDLYALASIKKFEDGIIEFE